MLNGFVLFQNQKGDANAWINQNRGDAGSEAGDSASKLYFYMLGHFANHLKKNFTVSVTYAHLCPSS